MDARGYRSYFVKTQLSLAQRQWLREQGVLFQTGMEFGNRPLQPPSTRIADSQSPETVLLPPPTPTVTQLIAAQDWTNE